MDKPITGQSEKRGLCRGVLGLEFLGMGTQKTPGDLYCGFQTAFSRSKTFNGRQKCKTFHFCLSRRGVERILKPACPGYVPGFSSVEKALATFPFSLTWGPFLGWNMEIGVKEALEIWSIPQVQYIFICLFIHALTTSKQNLRQLIRLIRWKQVPKLLSQNCKKKPSNKRHGNEENYIQKPKWRRFLLLSIKFSYWKIAE